MPGITIGGGGFDVSPFLQLQRQQQEDLQRAQDRADALNMQNATHTANVGASNFQYHQEQQTQQEALARQQAALQHQYAQQDLENQRQQQTFDRGNQWHADEQNHQQSALTQQANIHAASLAENERVRTANLAERQHFHDLNADAADLHLTGQLADKAAQDEEFAFHKATAASYDAAKHGLTDDAAYYKAEAELHRQKAAAARQSTMNERRPWEAPEPQMPELVNPQFALPGSPEAPPSPQTQTGMSFSGDPNEPPTPLFGGDTGAPDWSPTQESTASFQPGSQAGVQAAQKNFERMAAKAASLKQREDGAKAVQSRFDQREREKAASNPQAVADLSHSLRKQITPALLQSADPADAYEYAMATGRRLPPGTNQLQEEEDARNDAYVKNQIATGQMSGNTTKEMIWAHTHPGHNKYDIITAAKAILPSVVVPVDQTEAVQGQLKAVPPKPPTGVTKAAPGATPWSNDKDEATRQLLSGKQTLDVPEAIKTLPGDATDGDGFLTKAKNWFTGSVDDNWNDRMTYRELQKNPNESPRRYYPDLSPEENKRRGYMDAKDRAAFLSSHDEIGNPLPKAAQLPELYRTMSNDDLNKILSDPGNPAQPYAKQEIAARQREGVKAVPTTQPTKPAAQGSNTVFAPPTPLKAHMQAAAAQALQMNLSDEETAILVQKAKEDFLNQNK